MQAVHGKYPCTACIFAEHIIKEDKSLVRKLGLPECVTITGGAAIGVGLFTVGSSQAGIAGSSIIVTSIWSVFQRNSLRMETA